MALSCRTQIIIATIIGLALFAAFLALLLMPPKVTCWKNVNGNCIPVGQFTSCNIANGLYPTSNCLNGFKASTTSTLFSNKPAIWAQPTIDSPTIIDDVYCASIPGDSRTICVYRQGLTEFDGIDTSACDKCDLCPKLRPVDGNVQKIYASRN